ncbi:MAG: flagellar basal body rod protein FlgB [Nitrospiraceae bacterium]|nr:flagellar basal body rod protein FlgB [Nitrospiraceae bacterium]
MSQVHLFDRTTDLLKVTMDLRSRRHLLLVSNIANQDTPGYMARDLSFKKELSKALEAPTRRDLDRTDGALTINTDETVGNDLNTVNIELEMQKLASNTGNYNALASMAGWKYRMMGDAISGEGR